MKLNADPALRAVLDSTRLPWIDSPEAGVQRRMLERDGEERARATSIVRYLPGSRFARHGHDLGEEFFVLEGEFCDELGRYPAGTYVKNPAGSAHSPSSPAGCTIFVKLRQLDPLDQQRVVVQAGSGTWLPGLVPGLSVLPLSTFAGRQAALVRWAPGTRFKLHRHFGGEEIFVLGGLFEDEQGAYPAGTWLRNPHLSQHRPFSGEGCTILVITGHLPVEPQPAAA